MKITEIELQEYKDVAETYLLGQGQEFDDDEVLDLAYQMYEADK